MKRRDAEPVPLKTRLVADLGAVLLKLLLATNRTESVGWDTVERIHASGRRIIFAFWHGRMLIPLAAYRKRGVVVLISRHGDGALISRAVSHFGMGAVRGSTTRGGMAA